MFMCFFVECSVDHRVLHVLTHSYPTRRSSELVLEGINFTIPPKLSVCRVGRNCAGKSTLLSIIGGGDQPTRGVVKRHCLVSWPMGFGGGLQGSLTGRQNTKFVCRIHGQGHLIPEKIDYVQEFAEIGDAFDGPVKTYSSGMKARLQFRSEEHTSELQSLMRISYAV